MAKQLITILALACMLAAPACAQTGTKKTKTELSMERQGMVDIHTRDKSIPVSLMYSRADNFTGTVLYTDLTRAYLHPKAAAALAKAQRRLKQLRPDLTLKVYDAARPMSIQQRMWDKVKNTKKYFYVSNPARGGGLHNYGMAVDITLATLDGDTLDMGTKIDYMGSAAHHQPPGAEEPPAAAPGDALRRLPPPEDGVVALQPDIKGNGKEIL